MTEQESMVLASGHVLYEELPCDWEDMDDEALDNFVTEKAWEPFEGHGADWLWREISSLSNTIMSAYRRGQEEPRL